MRPKSVNPYGICFIILRFLSLFIIHIEQIYGKTDESDTFNATNLSVYLLFRAKTTIWRKKAILWKNDYPWENCHFAGKLQLQPRLHRKLRAY